MDMKAVPEAYLGNVCDEELVDSVPTVSLASGPIPPACSSYDRVTMHPHKAGS